MRRVTLLRELDWRSLSHRPPLIILVTSRRVLTCRALLHPCCALDDQVFGGGDFLITLLLTKAPSLAAANHV